MFEINNRVCKKLHIYQNLLSNECDYQIRLHDTLKSNYKYVINWISIQSYRSEQSN